MSAGGQSSLSSVRGHGLQRIDESEMEGYPHAAAQERAYAQAQEQAAAAAAAAASSPIGGRSLRDAGGSGGGGGSFRLRRSEPNVSFADDPPEAAPGAQQQQQQRQPHECVEMNCVVVVIGSGQIPPQPLPPPIPPGCVLKPLTPRNIAKCRQFGPPVCYSSLGISRDSQQLNVFVPLHPLVFQNALHKQVNASQKDMATR